MFTKGWSWKGKYGHGRERLVMKSKTVTELNVVTKEKNIWSWKEKDGHVQERMIMGRKG